MPLRYLSDGGEGFCKVISYYQKGRWQTLQAAGPLGDEITASYFIANQTAYIESASVAGYTLVDREKLNPAKMTSYGLGELIADAASRGVQKIVVGLGGTCTVDAGVGMLQALGAKFILRGGGILPDKSPALFSRITRMDVSAMKKISADIEVWSDTQAEMYGKVGAAWIYGRQKGLTDEDIPHADAWMRRMACLYSGRIWHKQGFGAAGGIGAALATVLKAKMLWGAEEIIGLSLLRNKIFSDLPALLITGEGKFDNQTLTGKLPAWVAEAGLECRKLSGSDLPKIVCLAGKVESVKTNKFDRIIQITPDGMPLKEALRSDIAADNLKEAILSWCGTD